MRFYASPHKLFRTVISRSSGIACVLLLLIGCNQQSLDYGFTINKVSVSSGYQSLNLRFHQDLSLSQQAQAALLHGVTLTIRLDVEVRHESNMMVINPTTRRFQIRYLPLSERFQLSDEATDNLQTFPRLRHALASIGTMAIKMGTGPLLGGDYEIRTRIRLDESRLPAPMQLPAWFSSEWQHDSEWSSWPLNISV